MVVLKRVFLLPPLAFGRFGSALRPCQAFSWAAPAVTPEGSSKTVLVPEDTVEVDSDGHPTLRPANSFNRIALKDDEGRFFPVCPFFELHGIWEADGIQEEGPITPALLAEAGLAVSDVHWSVQVANLKAFHYTLDDADRVEAHVEVGATDTRRHDLNGLSPEGATGRRLVPGPTSIKLGAVQVVRSTDELPGLRLRVYAPGGFVYAPADIEDRIAEDNDWRELDIPGDRRIIDPQAPWSTYRIGMDAPRPLNNDPRVNPGGLAATFQGSRSLGLLDDASDGIVTCRVGNLAPARARIAIGPPDFSPDSRPVVSLQDGLADRVARASARDDILTTDELEKLISDIFERALETSDLVNKDAQNERCHNENRQTLPAPSPDFEDPPIGTLWPVSARVGDLSSRVDALPIGFKGQRAHRRLNALEYLKDRLRSDPAFVERWIRPPLDDLRFFDRRMPALMRGSDRRPLHLTRRQYDLIRRWARSFVEQTSA
ncbi:hypothetical protein [Sinorhizobium medicae]|uniref:hypothetical protein n=1 Tax=Sinorhizobium medicae TaxID=110321 RepID=UPI000FD6F30C|nr:hypothetical protein [Sinorhizobium medicae]RVJ72532.1 hypothetical protein CN168_26685 [Sinorhizobium medicae]